MLPVSNLTSHISHLKKYAIIVAGGSGSRMQSIVPKQFLLLNGRPVLMYTIEAFHYSEAQPELIVVMHPNFHYYWEELCETHQFKIPHQLVSGGETRFHSVKNGLNLVDSASLAAVHDAVRPITGSDIIDESYRCAAIYGSAITAVKSRDSVRQLRGEFSESLLREEIYLLQTPQTFQSDLLKEAYLQPYLDSFTDDASVVEKAGTRVKLIEGNHQNIKITFPEDIVIAELLLKQKTT